jgi:uncharacterized protein
VRANEVPLQFTLKVATLCNLNCSYCYVYHKEDATWRERPHLMSEAVLEAAIHRIRRHCAASGQKTVNILFHGGEPCLMGADRFRRWCDRIRDSLQDQVRTRFILQTNATLLDRIWVEAIREQGVNVGVSLDGPQAIHDSVRVTHKLGGSYAMVVRGIDALRTADVSFSILSVVSFGTDGARVHRHLAELNPFSIDYILPDFTHATIGPIRERYGATPSADFLIAAFDEWWFNGTIDLAVSPFTHMARAILGGRHNVDFIGNNPLGYLFIETDGSIEGLDVLKVCQNGLSATGLNVFEHDFAAVRASSLHGQAVFEGMPLPSDCRQCPESVTCAGGYLPHRYSAVHGFDNRSVWCEDWLRLFAHLRERLNVDHEETKLRQQVLAELAGERLMLVDPWDREQPCT